jgi:hypothetical protein
VCVCSVPLECRGFPEEPVPFSPVHRQRKFSAVRGVTSAARVISMRPRGLLQHHTTQRVSITYITHSLTHALTLLAVLEADTSKPLNSLTHSFTYSHNTLTTPTPTPTLTHSLTFLPLHRSTPQGSWQHAEQPRGEWRRSPASSRGNNQ